MQLKKNNSLILFICLVLLFLCNNVWAISLPPIRNDFSKRKETTFPKLRVNKKRSDSILHLDPPKNLDKDLDRILHILYREKEKINKFSSSDFYCDNPYTTDYIYTKRLYNLSSTFHINYNPNIKNAIEVYVKNRRNLLKKILSLSRLYFPIIEVELKRLKLPLELKYIAIIESGLNPLAISPKGATGLWQFMPSTGQMYGLNINTFIDERLDPHKSTQAAALFLKDLYLKYGDWLLAIAAYNCGPTTIDRAVKKANGSKDFWVLAPYLPKETQAYIPRFIGIFYSMVYHNEHNILPSSLDETLAIDTIMLHKPITFEKITRLCKIDELDLALLNPQFKKKIVPFGSRPFSLKIPANKKKHLTQIRDSLYSTELEMKAYVQQISFPKSNTNKTKLYKPLIVHRVETGEDLHSISKLYHTNILAIKKWNRLQSTKLKKGQKLIIKK